MSITAIYRILLLCLLAVVLHTSAAEALPWNAKAPLSLNILNPDRSLDEVFRPYIVAVRKRIERRWFPQELERERRVTVFFQIGSDGQIVQAQVQKSSGDIAFDHSALRAVAEANPLHPPPSSQTHIFNIEASFDNRFIDRNQLRENFARYEQRRLQANQQLQQEEFARRQQEEERRRQQELAEQNQNIGAGLPEVSPPPPEKPETGNQQNDLQSLKLLTSKELAAMSEEEQEEYRIKFAEWLKLSPEVRFGKLLGSQNPAKKSRSK